MDNPSIRIDINRAVTGLLIAMALWLPGRVSAAGAEALAIPPDAVCACPDPYDSSVPAGIAWQGQAPAPDLREIARILAPVLWFSSDEPLIVLRDGAPLPHAHPADVPAYSAVVCFQATDIVLRGREQVLGTGETDSQFFDKVDHFRLKYFFYYDEDFGLRPHLHDLEAVELLVHLSRTPTGCVRLRVARIGGFLTGGYERGVIRRVREPGAEPEEVNGFASEAGLKFRVTLSGRARWAVLGYRFAGVRLGIRTSGFSPIQHPRFVVEFGAGAF